MAYFLSIRLLITTIRTRKCQLELILNPFSSIYTTIFFKINSPSAKKLWYKKKVRSPHPLGTRQGGGTTVA